MGYFQDLTVYKKAFDLAMLIFHTTAKFPAEEKYGLTSQIRRCSRSVCSNLAEGYRKRQYPAHFVSKMSDADMENRETTVWIDFAFHCGYIDHDLKESLSKKSEEIGRLLSYMINHSEKFQDTRKK
jgi:four helix bundle protein